MLGRITLMIAILAVSFGDRADADPTKDAKEAKERQERGRRLYATQDYEGAITEWRAAYVLVPNVDLLFAIGQAQRLKGDCASALVTYKNVLREKVSKKQVDEVEKVIAICEDTIAKAKPAEPAKPAPEPTPTPAPVVEAPAPAPTPMPIEPVRDTPKKSAWYTDKLGMGLLAGGVVGTAVGATFFVLANGASSDADAATSYEAFDSAAATAKRDRVISAVGFGVGGALIVGAVIR